MFTVTLQISSSRDISDNFETSRAVFVKHTPYVFERQNTTAHSQPENCLKRNEAT